MKLKASIAAAVAALAVAGLVALNAGASEKAPAAAQAPAAKQQTEIPDPNAGYPDGGKPDPASAGGWYLSPNQGN